MTIGVEPTEPSPVPSEDRPTEAARGRFDQARAGGLLFALVVIAAFPLYLIRGNEQWFFLDEWDFLSNRSATSFHDLLRPHNEHWSTLPILVYRTMWHFFGLRSYVPYQVLIISLHLIAAVLLWIVMRRARVHPFVATAAGAAFVLLGSGRENIVWAFQIGFVASLVFGLAQLLLADHDGPITWTDGLGLAFGLAGLLCSGVGVTMAIVVFVAVLIRRGLRPALFQAAPLGAVFVAWWLAYGRSSYGKAKLSLVPLVKFVAIGVWNGLGKIGQVPGVGAALVVLLVVGGILVVRGSPVNELRQRLAAPAALLCGALLFFVISGVGRASVPEFGPESARASRYVYLFTAMALPAIALGADAVARRWRVLTPVVLVLLVIGVPANIRAIRPSGQDRITLGDPRTIEALAHSPDARRVPRASHPLGVSGPEITVGWLLDGAASGRIPSPPRLSAAEQGSVSLALLLHQRRRGPSAVSCTILHAPRDRVLQAGESLTFAGANLNVQLLAHGKTSGYGSYRPARGRHLVALAGPLHLRLSPPVFGGPVSLCR